MVIYIYKEMLYIYSNIYIYIYMVICDAPNPGCPLTTRQPAEILYVSCYETYT